MVKYNKNKKRGLNKTEKKEITAMIASGKEDKQASTNTGLVPHNSAITHADLIRVIPSIPLGDKEGQRIGNEITAKRLHVQGLVNLYFDPSRSRSKIGVRVMIFSVKGIANAMTAIDNSSDWINAILRDGTNVRPFNGAIRDYFLPHNSDLITMHAERRFTLTQPFLWNTGLSPPAVTVPIQEQYATKFWKANIKVKGKKLKFSASTAGAVPDVFPNNYGCLMAVGYCKLDGSAPDVASTGLNMQTSAQIYYEDA